MNIDLQDKTQMLDMLENNLYEIANFATIDIKRSTVGNVPSQQHKIFGGEQCDLIVESVSLKMRWRNLENLPNIVTN